MTVSLDAWGKAVQLRKTRKSEGGGTQRRFETRGTLAAKIPNRSSATQN